MRAYALAAALAVMLLLPLAAAPAAYAQEQPVTITIGALLPLTGDLSDYGVRAEAAIRLAVEDVNSYLDQRGAWFRFDLRVEDTATQPDVAVSKLNTLIAEGIKFVIGPMTSAEVSKIKSIADSENVLVISPSSTAIELSIPDDNIYRFCPDDAFQAKAVVRLAKDLGAKAAVLVVRADTWGQGLKKEITNLLEQAGIEYQAYEYNPESPNFAAIASDAANKVEEYVNKYGYDKVVVYVISFKEAAQFFAQAKQYDVLRKVVWIGSDGTAKLDTIVKDVEAATFAEETLFINPIYSPAATENQDRIAQKVKDMVGQEPDAYSYAAYDAVWAIALALLDASPDMSPDDLVNHVKQKLEEGITETEEFAKYSATGAFPLNDAGDRATADYDFWIVYNGEWVKVGKYYGKEDRIEWEKPEALGGKDYMQLVQEKFAAITGAETPTETQTTPAATETETPTQPAETATTPAEGGVGAATIAAIVIIIIIVAAAAFLLARK